MNFNSSRSEPNQQTHCPVNPDTAPGNSFPVTLYTILARAETDNYSHIISWKNHGRSFHVHKKDKFVRDVLPLFSRQTKFSSFQRQLNIYNFKRITRRGPDYGTYYHEYFLKGRPDLLPRVQRLRSGDDRRQLPSSPGEITFSAMGPIPPPPLPLAPTQRLQSTQQIRHASLLRSSEGDNTSLDTRSELPMIRRGQISSFPGNPPGMNPSGIEVLGGPRAERSTVTNGDRQGQNEPTNGPIVGGGEVGPDQDTSLQEFLLGTGFGQGLQRTSSFSQQNSSGSSANITDILERLRRESSSDESANTNQQVTI